MTNTFIAYQVSSHETIRYEIPMVLQWVFDEWKDTNHMLTISTPRGSRLRHRTVQQILDAIKPECAELVDQVKTSKTPTPIWPRGHKGTVTMYDYPI